MRGNLEVGIMGDSVFSHILSLHLGRMRCPYGRAMVPVMSNSGSGNQGIAATLPVVIFAQERQKRGGVDKGR